MGEDTNNAAVDSLDRPLLQKEFHDFESIAANPFWEFLRRDIDTGDVFPAVRKGELQFYYGGGRILRFARKKFFCNDEYLGERQEGKDSREKAVPLDRPSDTYEQIKRRCQDHWNKKKSGESRATAELFKAFSFARKNRTISSPALIDVEICFRDGTKQDKIDLLFRLPSGQLCFVEVKRANDDRARRGSEGEPEVVEQLGRYCRQISRRPCEDVYRSVLTVWAALLQIEHQDVREAFRKVPLLLIDPEKTLPNSKWSKEVWQYEALQKAPSWTIDDDVLVIDGTKPETAVAAIDSFLIELNKRLERA